MSYPKRHHYLPRFYLDGFGERGVLHVYDADLDELRIQSPANTGLERHLYRLSNQETDSASIETALSAIEGKAKVWIEAMDHRSALTEEGRAILSEFSALMLVRVPVFDEEFRQLGDRLHKEAAKRMFPSEEAVESVMERIKPPPGSGLTAAQFFGFIQEERYRVVPDKDQMIRGKMPIAAALGSTLRGLDWLVASSPAGHRFITTDNPFTVAFPPQLPLSLVPKQLPNPYDATLVTPLSQYSCLAINSQGARGSIRLSKKEAYRLNLMLARNCYRFLIGPEPRLLARLAREANIALAPRHERAPLLGFFRRTRR